MDVDERRRIAKEAAEKAKDERDGEELRNRPKSHKEYGKSSKAYQDDNDEAGEFATEGQEPYVGLSGSGVHGAKTRARSVDPLVEATSGHLATGRTSTPSIEIGDLIVRWTTGRKCSRGNKTGLRSNYSRLKEQGVAIQTRIPLADGEARMQPNYGTKQKRKDNQKKGWAEADG